MKYYTIVNEEGEYYTGRDKIPATTIPVFSKRVESAKTYRDEKEAEGKRKRMSEPEKKALLILDSKEHARLAD